MNAEKLMICVIDNGSALLRERTLESLRNQTEHSFSQKTVDCTAFWNTDRNTLGAPGDYVLYLYSGSRLEENAVAALQKAVARTHAPWLYFDERTYGQEIIGDPYGVLEKPDFDPLSFAQEIYTGEGVLFSRAALEAMQLKYKGTSFSAALTEMTIAAAAQADGTHIRQCLLTRHNRRDLYPDEGNLLGDKLKEFLQIRAPEFSGLKRADGFGLHLLPGTRGKQKLSVILLGTDGDQPDYSGLEDVEVIRQTGTGSYQERCLQGARQAGNELLCFLEGGCGLPTGEDLDAMLYCASLPDAGFVSPCLYYENTIHYAGVFGYAGKPFRCEKTEATMRRIGRDIRKIRQTSAPARQFWMVSKQLLLQAAQAEKGSEGGALSPAEWLWECAFQMKAMGKRNLFLGSVWVRCTKEAADEIPPSFYRMLIRRKEACFLDPFCPTAIRSWMRMGELKDVQAYFPEQLADPVPGAKKLFVLSHELSLTGAPVVLAQAVRILKEAGWQIVVASPEDGVLKEEFLREGIPVLILGDLNGNADWLRCTADFDLILVNTIVPFRQIQQLRCTGLPVLWWLHDAKSGYEEYLRHVLPKTVGDNIHIFSVSQYADDAVKRYRPGYHTRLLLYGLKDEAPRVNGAAHPIPDAQGRKVFISVGTVIKRKGQDILARAVRLLPEDVRSRCLFLFIGKGIDEDIFRQVKALEQAYPESVRQIDVVPHDDIFNYFRQAAAVICSSRDDPLPTFMAETMMVSGVCICSENTGTAAVIEDGVNGYVYHNDDPEELADCICRVERCNDLSALRAASRKTFEEVFSLEIFKNNLLRCAAQCLEPREEGADNE